MYCVLFAIMMAAGRHIFNMGFLPTDDPIRPESIVCLHFFELPLYLFCSICDCFLDHIFWKMI